MKKINLLIVLCILLSSCIKFEIVTDGRQVRELSADELSLVVTPHTSAKLKETLKNDNLLYAVTGKQLKDFLRNKDTCLVYYWYAHCKSDNCFSMCAVKNYCDKKGYELIVVSEDIRLPDYIYRAKCLDYPLMAVNMDYYQKSSKRKNKKAFKADLIYPYSVKSKDFSKGGRYYLFYKGEYVKLVDPDEIKEANTGSSIYKNF
ncbi:MAG: hypothetical protein ACOX4D_07055 [Bacteroidales bacterium]|jgi:hypothetical protein